MFLCLSINEASLFQSAKVAKVLHLQEVPLTVFFQQEKLREVMAKKKSVDLCKSSHEGRPNPVRRFGSDDVGWMFTEDMLRRIPWANVFATGPEDPLLNLYGFFCMICRLNVSTRACGIYDIKRRYQSPSHLRLG